MSEVNETDKNSPSIEEMAFKKISDLLTKFHSILLPKTNNTSIFRDLSSDEQFLLSSLDAEHMLHSILAGCLAIDSCLKAILQIDNAYQSQVINAAQECLYQWTILEKALNKFQSISFKNDLFKYGQHFKKLIKIINKKDDRENKIQHKQYENEPNPTEIIANLNQQNRNLKQKLIRVEKQVVVLMKKTKKQNIHELKEELEYQKEAIQRFNQERNQLYAEIDKLNQQMEIIQNCKKTDLEYVIEELQYQNQVLKQERRHDEKIYEEILMKMELMCVGRGQRSRKNDDFLRKTISPKPSFYKGKEVKELKRPSSNLRKYTQTYEVNTPRRKQHRSEKYLFSGKKFFNAYGTVNN